MFIYLCEQITKKEKNQPHAFFNMKTRMTLPAWWAEGDGAEQKVKAVICCSSLPCPMRKLRREQHLSLPPVKSVQRGLFSDFFEDLCSQGAFPCTSWLQAVQLSFITVLLFLQCQSYCPASRPPTLAARWNPCSACWQTLEFPFSQPLPKPFPTASFASPVHLCNLSLAITLLTLIFSSTLPWWPLCLWHRPCCQSLLTRHCFPLSARIYLNFLLYPCFFCLPYCPHVSISEFLCPSSLAAPRNAARVALRCLSPTWNTTAFMAGKAAQPHQHRLCSLLSQVLFSNQLNLTALLW